MDKTAVTRFNRDVSRHNTNPNKSLLGFNLYNNPSEQTLAESQYDEVCQRFGLEVLYLPREFVDIDYILGEDLYSNFPESDYLDLKLYLINHEFYDGNGEMFMPYGVGNYHNATFHIVKSRFAYESEQQIQKEIKPKIGDLFKVKMNGDIMKVEGIEPEKEFYDRGKAYVYEMVCQKYIVGGEKFQTDDADLKDLETRTNEIPELSDNVKVETEVKDIFNEIADPNEDSVFGSY